MESNLFNQIFRDQEGNIVLAQMPNLPLITWIGASLLKIIFTTGKINLGLESPGVWCFIYLGLGRVISGS